MRGRLEYRLLAPAQILVTIPDRIPRDRRDRNALRQFAKNPPRHALHSGTTWRLTRASDIDKNHLSANERLSSFRQRTRLSRCYADAVRWERRARSSSRFVEARFASRPTQG